MPQISERRRMQNRLAQRKFRDKKQQQQLQLQQQQQQEQQQQRQRTNSYLQSATVSAPSRGRTSTHEDLHVRPHLKHMPHQAAHGLPLRIAAPAFSAPDYSSLSSYGSELDEVISPEELSYFPSAEHCGLSEDLDLEFSHFALSSSSLGQNMVQTPFEDFSFSDVTSYYGDKPHSSASSSYGGSFTHKSAFPSLDSQFALLGSPYSYHRKPSLGSLSSYHSYTSAWSGLSSSVATTKTEDTTPSVDPDSHQACYFSAASVPIAEPKASSLDTPVFLKTWHGITSPPQQDNQYKPLLHLSAERGRDNMVRQLIQQGVNINELDARGFTALELAMQNGHQQTVRILLECGADMHATAGPMWGPFNGTTLDPLGEDFNGMFEL